MNFTDYGIKNSRKPDHFSLWRGYLNYLCAFAVIFHQKEYIITKCFSFLNYRASFLIHNASDTTMIIMFL